MEFMLDDLDQPIYKTSDNVTHRMANKAGILRISENSRKTILKIALRTLQFMLERATVYAEHDDRKTLKSDDFSRVLTDLGGSPFGIEPVNGPCGAFQPKPKKSAKQSRRPPGSVAAEAVKFYQSQHECYYIPRNYFYSQVANILSEIEGYTSGRRTLLISANGLNLLQGIVELIIGNNLMVAKLLLNIKEKENLTAETVLQASQIVYEIKSNVF